MLKYDGAISTTDASGFNFLPWLKFESEFVLVPWLLLHDNGHFLPDSFFFSLSLSLLPSSCSRFFFLRLVLFCCSCVIFQVN